MFVEGFGGGSPAEGLAGPGVEGERDGVEVGSRGDSYDNALAESIIGLSKTELVRNSGPWRSLEDLELATLEWVDWFNHRRLLHRNGRVPPAEAEDAYYRQHHPGHQARTQTNQPA